MTDSDWESLIGHVSIPFYTFTTTTTATTTTTTTTAIINLCGNEKVL
jgi:hypothetical protein